MSGSRGTGRVGRRGAARRVAVVTALAVGLSVGVPAGALPKDGGFPLGWLWSWLRQAPGFSAPVVPVQPTGGPVGGDHHVSAEATRARGGSGRPAGSAPGALPADERPKPQVKQGTTPTLPGDHSFDPARSKRVASAASATSDVYSNVDGSFTRLVYPVPVNYRAADGTFEPVDRNLVAGANGRVRQRAAGLDLSFAPTADGLAIVRLPGGQSVSYSLVGASAAAGSASGDEVTYRGALRGMDVRVQAHPTGVRQATVLHSADAAASWLLRLDLRGLTAAVEPGGSVVFRDAAGTTRVAIPPGYADDFRFDARTGGFARSNAVRYELTTVDGVPALRVSVDGGWLRDPERQFPVTVNVALQVDRQVDDTYLLGVGGVDRSAEGELLVGGNGGEQARSFLGFGVVDAVYGSTRLSSVSLRLFNTWAADCAPKPVWVYPMTGPWRASTVAGNTVPSDRKAALGWARTEAGAACANTTGKPGAGSWVAAELKPEMFRDRTLSGLALVAEEGDSAGGRRFASADAAGNWPHLQVTYAANLPPQVDFQYPSSGQVVYDTLLQFWARGHDPDRSPNPTVSYFFTLFDRNGTKLADSGWITEGYWFLFPSQAPSRIGETYLWTVATGDGATASTNQTVNVFTIQMRQSVNAGLSQHGGRGFDPNPGNYTTSATDAVVATVGPALTIQRFYNSLELGRYSSYGIHRSNAFGTGWSSLLDSKITASGDVVTVHYPNGQEVTFGRNGDGPWVPPPGRHATLTGDHDVGFQFMDKDGTTYRFTTGGTEQVGWAWLLSSVTDAAGRVLTIGYNASWLPVTITSASGRKLYVTWSTPAGAVRPHVATVSTDPAVAGDPASASTWTYSYDGDRLTKVCPPTSATACTTYTYTNGSLYPHAVRDTAPSSYWRLNETSGTVAASSVPEHVGTDNGTYSNVARGQPGPLAGTTSTAAGFNGTSSYVSLPGRLLNTVWFKSIHLWFKANPGETGVLFSYSVDPITNSSTGGGYVPAVYIGASGKLYATFWPRPQIVTPAAVNDGQWHRLVLTGDHSSQFLYLDDGEWFGGSNGVAQDFGQRNAYLGAGFIGGGWPDNPYSGQIPQRSFFKGSIAEVSFYDRDVLRDTGFDSLLGRQGSYAATTPTVLLTSIKRPSGNPSATIAYDTATARVTQVTDQHGGVWKVSAPVASGSSQVYVASVLAGGPADYWRLAEGAGVTDAVNQVNGNTATYNAVTLGVSGGPFGDTNVASFNGTSSYLRMPPQDVPNTGPQSISMWFKTSTAGVLFGYEGGGGWVPALYVGTDGKLRGHFWVGNMSLIVTTPGAVTDGQWHHVALAASTNSQALYLDGKRVGNPVNAALQTIYADRAWVGYGRWEGGWPAHGSGQYGFFNGQIAEVAIYPTQITDKQIEAQHAARGQSAGAPVSTVTVTDPTNKTHKYIYDLPGGGRKVADVDALGRKTQYGYDTGGFLRTVTDPNGNVTTTEHDVRGNTVSSITCQDRSANRCSTVYFTYFPDATTRVLTPDPRNDVMLTMRDGRSASASDNTYLTSHTYDTKGNRTQVTHPLGRVTTTAHTDGTTVAAADGGFAPPGLPHKVITAGGATQQVVYFKSGDVAKITDPAGKQTTFSYDGLGRVLTKAETTDSFPGGLTTRYGYDKLGRVTSQTDPATTNRVTGAVHTPVMSTVYDTDGLVTSQTVSDSTGGDASRILSWTYNPRGQRTTATDPTGKITSFEYDAYGNLVKQTDPDGGVTKTAYDAKGQMLTTTTVGFTGDPNNPGPATDVVLESRAYDPAGRLATVTDAMGWVTAYTYTDNALTVTVTRRDPSTGASFVLQNSSYDAAGHLTSQVTNNGATATTATYDAAGRTTSSTLDPAGLKRTTGYQYSRDDHPVATTLTDAAGAVVGRQETMYDPLGRPVARTVHKAADPPVGRWRLNETTGSRAADATGNSPGTAVGGVAWSTDRGGSAVFDGAPGSAISTAGPVLDTTRSFTISAWVRLNSGTTVNKYAVSQEGTRRSGFLLGYEATGNRWRMMMATPNSDSSAASIGSTTVPAPGTWTHLTGVYDQAAAKLRLYVNGQLEGETAKSSVWDGALGPLHIGRARWTGVYGYHWPGAVSDVQTYQRALTATDIGAVYNGTAPAAGVGVIRTMWRLDQDGLPRAETDPNGNTTNYDYDEAGRRTVATAPAVPTETGGGAPVITRPVTYTGYDTFGAPVETKDPNGNVTTTGYDAAGRPTSTMLPSYTPPGGSTPITATATRTYDNLGRLTDSTDPLGNTTSHVYDQLGRVAKVTAPNLGVTKYTYDLLGDQLSTTDPTGATSTATFDFLGRQRTATRVVRQDNNAAHTTNYAYAAGGWLSSIQQPTGVTTAMTYNPAGETATVKDGANNTTTYGYDGAGRQTRTTLPDGSYTTVGYDLAGRPTATRSHSSAGAVLASRTAGYDHSGNVTAATDARGTTTTFGYDPVGRLTSQVQPVSGTDAISTGFGYDPAGNRTRFTDGRGNPFLTTYNSWNLPESRIEPATTAYPGAADRTFTVGYDAAARPAVLRAPGDVTVTNSYDTVGSLTRQVGAGAEAATADRDFGYDLAGRLISFSAPGGANTLSWDDRGLLRTTTGPAGAATFGYNPDGRMASRADAAGTTSYGYDGAGRLSTVSNPTAGIQASTVYNSLSQPATIVYGGNGNTRTLGYDGLHRLTSDELKTPGGASIAKIAYGYDANGNETAKTTTGFTGAAANTYSYDLADRLTSWHNGTTTVGYVYDQSGNRTQAGSRQFGYDQRNQLVTADGTAYSYTPRGTLATAGAVATEADAFGQITSQGVPGGSAQTYNYDALGRLVRDGFAYSGLGNHLAGAGTASYTRDPTGDLVGAASGAAKLFALTDLHTDVVGQFTATGSTLTGSVAYDPLGKILASTGMVGSLGYQSEWTDTATGRVNMWARWYNTSTGQFDSRDTAELSPTPRSVAANRFGYADANPLTVTDPTGHASWWDRAKNRVSSTWNTVTAAASTAWNAVTSTVSTAWNYAADKVNQAKQWVTDKYHQTRDNLAKKHQQAVQNLHKVFDKYRQAGRIVATAATRVVQQTANKVLDAAKTVQDAQRATEQWIKDHKDLLIDIAAIGAGIVAGLACTAVTAGVGALACMAGAAGLVNLARDAAHGNIHNWGDAFGSLGTGAATGLIGGAFGAAGGKLVGLAASKLGNLAGGIGGRIGGGAAAGGIADAGTQYATTGHVDWAGVGLAAGIGGVSGGFYRGGGPKGGGSRGRDRTAEPAPAACRVHSFDPATRVLMADGSTRPIKDVGVGDKVVATDPKAGTTGAKPVLALHLNRDTDLTDVTVTNRAGGKGTTATLKTTQHHPFWDATLGSWVLAAALVVGHQLRGPNGLTETVVAVRNHTGAQDMRDLTVADTHTYYVMASNAPILVHNCGGARFSVDSDGVATDLDRTVYRVLRPAENPAAGLHPKDLNANVDLGEFVAHGSRPGFTSQWIATTRSRDVAASWGARTGNRVAEINLDMVPGNNVDLTTPQARSYWLLEWKARGFAMRSQEVDIEGSIPASAIIGVFQP